MKVVMFGASGTVGQGVLQECLRDQEVQLVVSVVRAATGKQHEKLHEIVHQNFLDLIRKNLIVPDLWHLSCIP